MTIRNKGASYICDQCGFTLEVDSAYSSATPGWITVEQEKAESPLSYDEYHFCSWGCVRNFSDQKYAQVPWQEPGA